MRGMKSVLILCLSCVVHELWAFDLSDVRIPDNTKSEWVGQGIEHNGVTMDVMVLRSNHSSDQLITFYKNMWESGGGQGEGYTINEAGDYKIISRLEGDRSIVVQVRDNGKGYAEGYLSAIDISSLGRADSNDDFPAMSNTMLVSKTVSEDTGKTAVTRVLVNAHSVASNMEFYRHTFESDGWKKSFADEAGSTYMALYSRNNMTMEIAISRDPGKDTVIFVNVVDES